MPVFSFIVSHRSRIGARVRCQVFTQTSSMHPMYFADCSGQQLLLDWSLDRGGITGIHSHKARLSPGDMVLIPSTWLHTTSPMSEMSLAVNVVFRDFAGSDCLRRIADDLLQAALEMG